MARLPGAKQLRVRYGFAKALVAAGFFVDCSTAATPSDPPCVVGLKTDCLPQYDPPTYQTIFDKILRPTCASGVGTCHTSDGAKAGLVFENADPSYKLLLGTEGGRARVIAGDPSCSVIMKRVASTDPSYHMPPGPSSILPGEACTIVKWIAEGAKR
jgi:hypothetical protein